MKKPQCQLKGRQLPSQQYPWLSMGFKENSQMNHLSFSFQNISSLYLHCLIPQPIVMYGYLNSLKFSKMKNSILWSYHISYNTATCNYCLYPGQCKTEQCHHHREFSGQDGSRYFTTFNTKQCFENFGNYILKEGCTAKILNLRHI